MFDTRTVGKKIAALRKEKNKTQMELADEMGVSYQAVSNWERGNSMPDISKLPQLSLILGCSVDEILGESKEAELVEHVIDGTQKEYMVEENPEVDTVAAVVPLIKPEQTKDMAEIVVESAHREDEREAEQETENQSKKEKKREKRR
ncbi:MAG: helix-turn-helix transcriptional regulator [Lachnospiraceae bacterium]|nr:helix-turn-helix transcriptional regulator [Lachnospiraceae bacterium]